MTGSDSLNAFSIDCINFPGSEYLLDLMFCDFHGYTLNNKFLSWEQFNSKMNKNPGFTEDIVWPKFQDHKVALRVCTTMPYLGKQLMYVNRILEYSQ